MSTTTEVCAAPALAVTSPTPAVNAVTVAVEEGVPGVTAAADADDVQVTTAPDRG